jgi:hypothetical protein
MERFAISKRDIFAVLLGLVLLYAGTFLLFVLFFDLYNTSDKYVSSINWITVVFLAGLYIFSGWIVLTLARIKAWSVGIIPSLIIVFSVSVILLLSNNVQFPPVSFIDWISLPLLVTFFSEPLFDGYTFMAVLAFLPLIGGIAAKYLHFKKVY